MQQQRRQRGHRDRVTPVEDPVEPVERSVERERERAEERDAQPEEMQRRLVGRASQANRGAHEQREEADRRQHEVHRARGVERRKRDRQRLSRTESDNRVGEPRALVTAMLKLDDVRGRLDRRAVDGDEHVARPMPAPDAGRARRHLDRRHPFGRALHNTPSSTSCHCSPHRDVRQRQARSAPTTTTMREHETVPRSASGSRRASC